MDDALSPASTLWFLRPDCARSLLHSICPLQSLCRALSSGVNHNRHWGSFSHLRPLPAAKPGCLLPLVVEGWNSKDSLFTPFNGWRAVDGATWELIRVWGILVHLFPPCWFYLQSTFFIGWISPVCIHGVGVTLVQFRVVSLIAGE